MNSQPGKCSSFGGPGDSGVAADEGLALYDSVDSNAYDPDGAPLFLPEQPVGTTGPARALNPWSMYCAMRWDYSKTPASQLRQMAVTVSFGNRSIEVSPTDWGPNENTGRLIDLSPGALFALSAKTDDVVTVTMPDT